MISGKQVVIFFYFSLVYLPGMREIIWGFFRFCKQASFQCAFYSIKQTAIEVSLKVWHLSLHIP